MGAMRKNWNRLRNRILPPLSALLLSAMLVSSAAAGLLAAGLLSAVTAEAATTKVVVLDPGHGGWEKGACYYGMMEKVLNLKIAKYCQAELNTYEGVRVILTRTTDKVVAEGGTTPDLKARCRIAKNNRADIFVCLHNNAFGEGESEKTNGARVYYQNHSFYSSVGDASHRLASMIVNRVAACGVANGGARTKYSPDKSRRDKNGNKGDYYGVLYYNKVEKIPAVIVEHAFMSNAGDAAKLKKESFLKSLGKADAAAIAQYLGLKKKAPVIRTGWYTSVTTGKKYYFNAAGKKVTGWQTIGGKKYYFSTKTGEMLTGWRVTATRKYYFSPTDGHLFMGLQKVGQWKYFFNTKDGHLTTGWQTIGGKKYFFSRTNGRMCTGTQTIDGKKYRFSSTGVLEKAF